MRGAYVVMVWSDPVRAVVNTLMCLFFIWVLALTVAMPRAEYRRLGTKKWFYVAVLGVGASVGGIGLPVGAFIVLYKRTGWHRVSSTEVRWARSTLRAVVFALLAAVIYLGSRRDVQWSAGSFA